MTTKRFFNSLAAAMIACCATGVFTSCSGFIDAVVGNVDNPAPTTQTTNDAAQLKQGIWTEYDEALLTSGKYTEDELAQMPTVAMWIQGDKGYFFTYTAETVSDPVEGQISYNKSANTGTITFPYIAGNPLSIQTVNFSMTSDETMQFEFTYEGQKTTATCAWLCENLDNWSSEITDADWQELMTYYQTFDEEAGPDASIDWSDSEVAGLGEPLPWDEEAETKAGTRSTVGSVTKTIGNVFSSLFEEDPNDKINEKFDKLMEKVDQVLANQQKMLEKLNEINERLKAIANKLNQQETVNIINTRNVTYYNPLNLQNIKYFNDAYDLYKNNKNNLSQENKDKLGEYAKKWVGAGEAYADLTWNYMKYITTVEHSSYGTGLDKIYDGMTFDKYPWEHMGVGDRQSYRNYDLSMIAKGLFMIALYAQYGGLTDVQKQGLYNVYFSYTPQLNAFSKFSVTDPDKFRVCQIPGAHFVMHRELQEFNYVGSGSEAPDPRVYGSDAIYMPKWHVAGNIKISNPAEMRKKLIPWFKADAILKYFGSQYSWVNTLIEGHQNSGGATCTNKPGANATLLLYDNGNGKKNGAEATEDTSSALLPANFGLMLRIYNVTWDHQTHDYIDLKWLMWEKDEHKWEEFMDSNPKQFYAAIVERHF